MRRILISIGAVALVFAWTACGGGGVEEQLEAASESLASARESVEEARRVVAERQVDALSAQEKLNAAKDGLHEAEEALRGQEAVVDLSATDAVLFRSIQKRLLEDDSLADVAISASVVKGIVTLSGSVPDAELKEHALEIAKATPGVSGVRSSIQVEAVAEEN